jgi:hypothetical protein
MFEDINFAKLVQQQVVSCFAIFRKRNPIAGGGPLPSTDGYGLPETEQTGAGTRYIENIGPGMEIIGGEGEELQGFSPNVPNAEFFDHVKLMLQIIGVNLGLPLCLVLMDGSETNFSGWRGAVDEARKGFRANQTNLLNRLHKPVYEFKLRQWIAEDRALAAAAKVEGINIFGHRWNPPTWQYIDPVADAQGDALRIQNALTSPRRLHAEGGRDWEEVADEIVEDMSYAIIRAKQQAKAINGQFQDNAPVHWRELISLPMPSGIQMTMQDSQAMVQQAEAQAEATAAEQAPTAEMVGVGRKNWQNARKAINDILKELTGGQISERRARLELDSLGVPASKIDVYIEDASDGTIDTPEEQLTDE